LDFPQHRLSEIFEDLWNETVGRVDVEMFETAGATVTLEQSTPITLGLSASGAG
jgi:hypothetical protein